MATSAAQGRYLDAATAREPVAVLGAAAAQRLGFDRIWNGMRIQVGGIWFYVAGILNPAALAAEIDAWPRARRASPRPQRARYSTFETGPPTKG